MCVGDCLACVLYYYYIYMFALVYIIEENYVNPKVEIQEEMKEEKRTNECVLEGALTLLPSFFFPLSLSLCCVLCVYRVGW